MAIGDAHLTLKTSFLRISLQLKLLSRKRYPDSDLDLYVEHRYGSCLGSFLEEIGYNFKPTQGQPKRLAAAINKADGMETKALYDDELAGNGFGGVFNMARGGRTIQVITAAESPLDIILNFHSTVVMNVISYSHVYSLYPRATFQESLSLITYCNDGSEREVARQKYVDRGWKMLNFDGSEWNFDRSMEIASYSSSSYQGLTEEYIDAFQVNSLRHLGDSYCWSFKLPIPDYPTENNCSTTQGYRWLMSRRYDLPTPLVMEELLTGKQALESNTWVLSLQDYDEEADDDRRILSNSIQTRRVARDRYRPDPIYRMLYDVLSNSQLRFTYCVGLESEDYATHELIERVRASEVVRRGGRRTEGGYGFSPPLDFRAKSIDLLLYDVVDEHLNLEDKYLDEATDTESEGDSESTVSDGDSEGSMDLF
ncbi:hypothetical protein E1B28_012764 [Marasmius oreades]|uniref:Uncharacterized protein n=1 Tax=Marasmius oreades TaxID=181124 RepID=A0A9P7UP15_9AGAR|nr:uncharacterized protein E1B28_012764 [Marasmius oreades]KAG7088803.1 hypothetical protein E1B28_012764 [Marasmius oreades]